MYCECNKIQKFWEKILKWWEKRTSEDLLPNPRTVILGIRKKETHSLDTQFPETELPFTYLRTIAYGIIRKERYKLQQGLKESTINEMVKETLKKLQQHANMLYHKVKQWEKWQDHKPNKASQDKKTKDTTTSSYRHSLAYFKECWEESGIAKLTNTKTLPVILRGV